MFNFDIYVNNVGPKSNNDFDIDLEYIHLAVGMVTGCNRFQNWSQIMTLTLTLNIFI